MIIFATLGFDERFIIRDLLSRGIKEPATIILFSSSEDEKVDKAYNTIKNFVKPLNVNVEKITINIKDPYYAISEIRKIIKEYIKKDFNVVFNLSGGQRILIFYILAVIASLGIKGEIVMVSEDSTFSISLPTDIFFNLNLDEVERKILEFMKDKSVKPKEIIEGLGISRVTVWRKLQRLISLGLVEYKNRKYCLTNLGYTKV